VETEEQSLQSEQKLEKTVLLVEDNRPIASLLVAAISRATTCQILHAVDGFTALQMVTRTEPHLLVLDYQLPDTNGVDLYKQIHEMKEQESIPTIFISSDLPPLSIKNSNIVRMNKPFTIRAFLVKVNALLSNPIPELHFAASEQEKLPLLPK